MGSHQIGAGTYGCRHGGSTRIRPPAIKEECGLFWLVLYHTPLVSQDTQLNMRLPTSLLNAVKQRAKLRRMPYTRFIREILGRSPQERTSKRTEPSL